MKKSSLTMLKLRTIGIRDYSVFGRRAAHRPDSLRRRAHTGHLALERHHPPDRRPPDGLSQGLRHGQGGVQGGLDGPEGQNLAFAARGSLPGNEHSGRRLRDGTFLAMRISRAALSFRSRESRAPEPADRCTESLWSEIARPISRVRACCWRRHAATSGCGTCC
jgi:hypothetical protein